MEFKRRPLDGDDIDRLINNCHKPKEKLIVCVLLDTGLRVGEFTKLRPDNIFWQRGYIVLRGKGGKERRVPMTERTKRLLEAHFALSDEIGMSAVTAQNTVRRIAERAGIKAKVCPHVLRHTFAVEALKAGVDIRALQQAMGHSNLTITEQYLNYVPDTVISSFSKAGWL